MDRQKKLLLFGAAWVSALLLTWFYYANAVALASYPLAALAMDRLLLALGCGGLVAWTGGLLFALGPLRVPGNLQVLQYPNVYLPLLALALMRLRREPDARAGAQIFLRRRRMPPPPRESRRRDKGGIWRAANLAGGWAQR